MSNELRLWERKINQKKQSNEEMNSFLKIVGKLYQRVETNNGNICSETNT
jgi:hypothetical protein